MPTLRQQAGIRERSNARRFQQIHTFIALVDIVVRHVEAKLTLNPLLILSALWEAVLKGNLLSVSDVANLGDLPNSTDSSTLARLSNFAPNCMGLTARESDLLDKQTIFVRPLQQLVRLAHFMTQTYANYMEPIDRAIDGRKSE